MSDAPRQSRWRRLVFHPVFPFLVYLALTQVIRDNYPFSHYPMYSKPNSESLSFQYLADGEGNPLPLKWHTGMTPSQLSKIHRDRLRKHPTEQEAALDVLQTVREMNEARSAKRPLPEKIELMQDTMGFSKDGKLVETKRMLAQQSVPAKS
jgi:hypothetical protein